MSGLKVTRRKITVADRLAEVDSAIEATQVKLQHLTEKRAAIVSEAKQAAADLLAQVEG